MEKTYKALENLCCRVKEAGAETLVIITPHGPVHSDAVTVMSGEKLKGDFAGFGAGSVALELQTDRELLNELKQQAEQAGVKVAFREEGRLDHGVTVPLYYLYQQLRIPGLAMAFSMEPSSRQYEFGVILQKAIEKRGLKTAVIASGDLSHRLTPQAPAGYDPGAKEFDRTLVQLLREYRVEDILGMDQSLIDRAGECGFRSLVILLGCLKGMEVKQEVLSYEGPFGVGYMVASFEPVNISEPERQNSSSCSRPDACTNKRQDRALKGEELTGLARQSLQNYLLDGKPLPGPEKMVPELEEEKSGVFVSLKKKGRLRGCIGTVMPACDNLAREIAVNAVKAGFEDPRFPPLRAGELEEITVSVDVLSPMEQVEDISRLDPRYYGLLVVSGKKSGLLLPDLEGIDTVEEQLRVAMQKGGISPGDTYQAYCFTVHRYTEEGDEDV